MCVLLARERQALPAKECEMPRNKTDEFEVVTEGDEVIKVTEFTDIIHSSGNKGPRRTQWQKTLEIGGGRDISPRGPNEYDIIYPDGTRIRAWRIR
jgi:hypothetical protein